MLELGVNVAESLVAWGGPDRYYAEAAVRRGERAHSSSGDPDDRVGRTLESVVPGRRELVKRTVGLWNQKVRNHLAKELAFQLHGQNVPIEIAEGLPQPLLRVIPDVYGPDLLFLLNGPLLRQVVEGTRFMASVHEQVQRRHEPHAGPASRADLETVRRTAEAWLAL